MPLSGATAAIQVIKSTANQATTTGNLTIAAGELIIIGIGAWSGVSGEPTAWTVTFDGATITPIVSGGGASITSGTAIYVIDNTSGAYGSGTKVLSVGGNGTFRAVVAVAYRITGHNPAAPIAGSSLASSWTANVTTLSAVRNPTTQDGNALIDFTVVRNMLANEFSSTGSGTLAYADFSGATSTSDIGFASVAEVVAVAGNTTHTVQWTTALRAGLVWVEVNVATGTVVSSDGFADAMGDAFSPMAAFEVRAGYADGWTDGNGPATVFELRGGFGDAWSDGFGGSITATFVAAGGFSDGWPDGVGRAAVIEARSGLSDQMAEAFVRATVLEVRAGQADALLEALGRAGVLEPRSGVADASTVIGFVVVDQIMGSLAHPGRCAGPGAWSARVLGQTVRAEPVTAGGIGFTVLGNDA